jgi:hypothetical protein
MKPGGSGTEAGIPGDCPVICHYSRIRFTRAANDAASSALTEICPMERRERRVDRTATLRTHRGSAGLLLALQAAQGA